MSKEEALETLTSLKAEFDAAVKDAQEDGRRFRWLRHYTDPKAREDEFAGYAKQAVAVTELVAKDDKAAATAQLQGMKAAFDAVSADYRNAPQDFLEGCFGLYAQEAYRFERFAQTCEKVMKLV